MLASDTVLQERYRIVRQLGQGGMGAVYEAVDLRLDATVALKETLFVEEKLRKQFEREARLLARLHHPALPRVSDHFDEAAGAFLVMQYVAGDDLAEMITRRRGPFPQEQVLLWGDQLLDALDYLHTQDPQIIHRDIKPQNLKLSSRGQIILLDFGLAKGQAGELSRATSSASIFGYTPNYAPLEQVQGLGTDPRSDIYALAATLYHLLTSVKPPDALTRAAAIVNGQPDPLQRADEVNPAVSAQAAMVLQRAMAQNREQRYSSAAEMRNAFHPGLEDTLGARGEAATVLLPSAPTRIAVANPTAKATVAQTGETTVVHINKKPGQPWAIAAGILLFAGIAFGSFYTYQHRGGSAPAGTPAVSSPSVQPSAPDNQSSVTETAKPNVDQKKASTPNQSAARKEAKETVSRSEKPAEQKPSPANEPRRAASRPLPAPATPEPNADIPDPNLDPNARDRRGGRRMPEGIRVRNRPDGARVMIAPNGARIVTLSDGSTRVFPPPGKKRRQRP
jgi:serine/threonine protein kinase